MLFPEAEVTRLLSNLLKSSYLVFQSQEKRVIDSNDLIAKKLAKTPEPDSMVEENAFGDGFNLGLQAERVELLLEDQEEPVPEINIEEILEDARIQADQIIANAKQEAEQLKSAAYEEGKKEGFDTGCLARNEELDTREEMLKKREEELLEEFEERVNKLEPELVDTIAGIFEGVFRIQFGTSKEMVSHLVEGALGKITSSKEFIIHVARMDYEYMKQQKEAIMEMVPNANFIEITEDATLSKNQCMIETDGGVFDCSLDIQMENLVKALKTLSYT